MDNSKGNIYNLAKDIYEWCQKHGFWIDICIYFDGKAWASWDEWSTEKGKLIDGKLYEYENKDPKDYFEYVGNPHILSMSFEGPLYDILNHYTTFSGCFSSQFINIFDKYGYYYELGNAWNLSVCEK